MGERTGAYSVWLFDEYSSDLKRKLRNIHTGVFSHCEFCEGRRNESRTLFSGAI
jgi:hypothetical protein